MVCVQVLWRSVLSIPSGILQPLLEPHGDTRCNRFQFLRGFYIRELESGVALLIYFQFLRGFYYVVAASRAALGPNLSIPSGILRSFQLAPPVFVMVTFNSFGDSTRAGHPPSSQAPW